MTLIVTEPNWQEIVKHASHAYYKLVLVVGDFGSGKSKVLKQISESYNFKQLNLGLELSKKLMEVPKDFRSSDAEKVVFDLLDAQPNKRVAIDNIEVLFEDPLNLNPLQLLKKVSMDRVIVAAWPGQHTQNTIQYGFRGHPAFREYRFENQDTFTIIPNPI